MTKFFKVPCVKCRQTAFYRSAPFGPLRTCRRCRDGASVSSFQWLIYESVVACGSCHVCGNNPSEFAWNNATGMVVGINFSTQPRTLKDACVQMWECTPICKKCMAKHCRHRVDSAEMGANLSSFGLIATTLASTLPNKFREWLILGCKHACDEREPYETVPDSGAFTPSEFAPGSEEKIELLRQRAEAAVAIGKRASMFVPGDSATATKKPLTHAMEFGREFPPADRELTRAVGRAIRKMIYQ